MSTAQAAATGGGHSAPPISTVAGTGGAGFKGENEPAVEAELDSPYGIAVDGAGTLYICDVNNFRIRKVTADGKISTFAGLDSAGFDGDGGPATAAQFKGPMGVAVDSTGAVYIADCWNHRVRKVTADGKVRTFAGSSPADVGRGGFAGDDGLATSAQLNRPIGVAVDSAGVVYIVDQRNHRVRKVTADGKISTFAGMSSAGFHGGFGGDGGLATSAELRNPQGVAVDGAGDVYIADTGNHRVRKVTGDGKISTFAGSGPAGFNGGFDGDGGPATSAQLNAPAGIVVDSTGVLYIADIANHRVRKVTADGKISTFAGSGPAGFNGGFDGDGGPATSAELRRPFALAVDFVDALYIADTGNHRVRKVASAKMAGLPDSGTVVAWANVRSRLRMGVLGESTRDGAEVHQLHTVPRDHQRWRLVVVGLDSGDVLYRIENVRSGKVLEVIGAQKVAGAAVAQRAYEGIDARHQQWRLIPVGSGNGTPRVYEIANRGSGLLLRVDNNTPRTVIKQHKSQGDHQGQQWQLLPV
ncbi:RICIN domain-containing protein [Streptomyces sp. 378]|uniref:NHL domain-containing protein n=1 Tax=Streptomyces sp. 378 TaxID=3049412 RepID=UPI0024C2DC49|nr:RICIN domain-containing protein [Streptomyces sp. 378]MDK1347686.1 RICIN domain-containing protein [Streptomyces sp. 378]